MALLMGKTQINSFGNCELWFMRTVMDSKLRKIERVQWIEIRSWCPDYVWSFKSVSHLLLLTNIYLGRRHQERDYHDGITVFIVIMSLQSAAAFALLPSQLESRHFHARVFTCLCLSTGASNHFINGRNLAKKQTHRYTRAHLGHLIRFINAILTFQTHLAGKNICCISSFSWNGHGRNLGNWHAS